MKTLLTLFGFYVMAVCNTALYSPYDSIGYFLTAGMIVTVVSVHKMLLVGAR